MTRTLVHFLLILSFLALINTDRSFSQQHPQLQEHSLLQIKQSMIKQSLHPSIISSLNYLTVFSFSPKMSLSSPLDLHGKRIVIIHPYSPAENVYNQDESEILVSDLVLTETVFKSQLEMYNKNGNQSKIIPESVQTFNYLYIDCIFGNPIDLYDVFVMSSEDFLRSFVQSLPRKREWNGLYEWSDFSFLSEFQVPISVSVYYNETNLN
ncbi:predicted protein [Naegleria gruberi]|uniref:Predicted protein n=1 Tax=Naegleria gruberi TaxID=5762 RepID=D2W097_NAEGR|nr:uncharacterized protein NAEGRDRAFT_74780 [Naegleria gruberi]EFC37577.1 predicted protein [Naegleria gruberi]|eukprot:XP_002670321.1 predicted protein [Naegleria gruberi strain NEG-M]